MSQRDHAVWTDAYAEHADRAIEPIDQDIVASVPGKSVKKLISVLIVLVTPVTILARDNYFKLTYDGGSLPRAKVGTVIKLYVATNQIRFEMEREDWITVPANAITEIRHSQDVQRRPGSANADRSAPGASGPAVRKSKKQYIGLTWAEGERAGGLSMQCDKSECGSVLTALEGLTGIKPMNSEIPYPLAITAEN